jgi:hypothetical protein
MGPLGRMEILFLAVMIAAGLGTAMLVTRNPALDAGFLPPLVWPLGVSLAFDLATVALRGGGPPPLPMPVRIAGTVLAMVLVVVLQGRV